MYLSALYLSIFSYNKMSFQIFSISQNNYFNLKYMYSKCTSIKHHLKCIHSKMHQNYNKMHAF